MSIAGPPMGPPICHICNAPISTDVWLIVNDQHQCANHQMEFSGAAPLTAITPPLGAVPNTDTLEVLLDRMEQIEGYEWVTSYELATLYRLVSLVRAYLEPDDPWRRVPLREEIQEALAEIPLSHVERLMKLANPEIK